MIIGKERNMVRMTNTIAAILRKEGVMMMMITTTTLITVTILTKIAV